MRNLATNHWHDTTYEECHFGGRDKRDLRLGGRRNLLADKGCDEAPPT